jgi:uncharacterized protein
VIVVSDSGPIINLALLGRIELLPELFGEVLVPGVVFREVVEAGAGLPGAAELKAATWATVEDPAGPTAISRVLASELHAGEAAAILPALERGAERLLVDDLAARRAASRLGLSITGTIGILLAAKQKGLVGAVRPLLQALKQRGFWVSQALETAVLRDAGEEA